MNVTAAVIWLKIGKEGIEEVDRYYLASMRTNDDERSSLGCFFGVWKQLCWNTSLLTIKHL